jgi:hypothetical protein
MAWIGWLEGRGEESGWVLGRRDVERLDALEMGFYL